jgi:nucleoid DNA-binding protein
MNKTEIEAQIAEDTGINKKTVAEIIQAFQSVVTQSLSRGEAVRLTGFVNLKVKDRPARQGKNPKTGAPTEIPFRRRVTLTVGKDLNTAING